MTTSVAPGPPVTPPAAPPSVTPPAPSPLTAPGVAAPSPPTLRRRVAELTTTTPGRLRLESVLLVALALITGLFTGWVVNGRLGATNRIAEENVPVIVSARQVQTGLAEANAAAATAFLAGGVENADQRQLYEDSIAEVGRELENAARLTGDDQEAHDALQTLNSGLPVYSGLIEQARANNRQGFPVSAAYLNAASRLLDEQLFPATDVVANRAAERYRSAYDEQRGVSLVLAVVAVGLHLLVVLFLTRLLLQLRRRFKRTLNLPLLLALGVAVALTGWLISGLTRQSSHLAAARTDGYQGTRLYLDARGAAFGAKADEARYLLARGAGQAFEDDFLSRAGQFDDLAAALDDHVATTGGSAARADADATTAAWSRYVQSHAGLIELDAKGERSAAVTAALSEATPAFAAFDDTSTTALDHQQAEFASEMDQAAGSLGGLRLGDLLGVVLLAAAGAYGLQQRINEYR